MSTANDSKQQITVVFDADSQLLRIDFDKDKIKNPQYAVALLGMAQRWFETQMQAGATVQTMKAMQAQANEQQALRNLLKS